MKILITGNMGYMGPAVVRQLRASYPDDMLIGYDLGLFSSCLTNTGHLPECQVDIQYFKDVRSFPAAILTGIDVIVHLAAISNDPIGDKYKDVTMAINYTASKNLAILAKKAGVKKFIFASSCSVYGCAENEFMTEKSPVNPLSTYAESKLLTEKALEGLADKKFTVTCLRFATGCGMSARLRLDLVLNDFAASAVALKKITVLSDGTSWRALIDVRDFARAIDWAITRSPANGGEYLIVNAGFAQGNYQIRELAEAVGQIIPDSTVSINKEAPADKRSYKVNFTLFKLLAPGFQPQHDLFSTVRELVSGLKAMGFNDENFRDSNLIRFKALEQMREKKLLDQQLQWAFSKH